MAPYHVNVNSVCPGIIWTPSWKENATLMAETRPEFKGMTPEQVFMLIVKHEIPFGIPQKHRRISAIWLSFYVRMNQRK